MSTATAVKKKLSNFSKIKVGTKLSETQYYTVTKVGPDEIEVTNDLGDEISLPDSYVESLLYSADQFSETKEMSRTDLTNLFLSTTNVITTVNYNKKVDEKEVLKAFESLYPNKGGRILSEADFKKAVKANLKSALTGEERTMVGRHYGSQDEFGRIRFIDMDEVKDASKDYDTRQRLVDPRTINWVILRGVKYTVK